MTFPLKRFNNNKNNNNINNNNDNTKYAMLKSRSYH